MWGFPSESSTLLIVWFSSCNQVINFKVHAPGRNEYNICFLVSFLKFHLSCRNIARLKEFNALFVWFSFPLHFIVNKVM